MSDPIRGKIYNKEKASHTRDFSGLRYGNITPTDIDGVMEFRDRLFIFFEYKGADAPLSFGQQTCFESIVNSIQSDERIAVCIVANHYGRLCDEIDCANASVRSFLYLGKWTIPAKPITVKTLVEIFCEIALGWDCELDVCLADIDGSKP